VRTKAKQAEASPIHEYLTKDGSNDGPVLFCSGGK
jgi:hypothetical protein